MIKMVYQRLPCGNATGPHYDIFETKNDMDTVGDWIGCATLSPTGAKIVALGIEKYNSLARRSAK